MTQYINHHTRHEIFRVYVTDSLKFIAENTAKSNGGSVMTKRYYEIVDDSKPKPQKSAEEIVADVIKRAGLEVV